MEFIGLLFKHGEDDYELWQIDTPEQMRKIMELWQNGNPGEILATISPSDGCSTRGTMEQIASDIR